MHLAFIDAVAHRTGLIMYHNSFRKTFRSEQISQAVVISIVYATYTAPQTNLHNIITHYIIQAYQRHGFQ